MNRYAVRIIVFTCLLFGWSKDIFGAGQFVVRVGSEAVQEALEVGVRESVEGLATKMVAAGASNFDSVVSALAKLPAESIESLSKLASQSTDALMPLAKMSNLDAITSNQALFNGVLNKLNRKGADQLCGNLDLLLKNGVDPSSLSVKLNNPSLTKPFTKQSLEAMGLNGLDANVIMSSQRSSMSILNKASSYATDTLYSVQKNIIDPIKSAVTKSADNVGTEGAQKSSLKLAGNDVDKFAKTSFMGRGKFTHFVAGALDGADEALEGALKGQKNNIDQLIKGGGQNADEVLNLSRQLDEINFKLNNLAVKNSNILNRVWNKVSFGGAAFWVGMTILGGTVMMLPGIVQAQFMAQQQINAMIATYASPVKFGNVVLQIPDSAINTSDPMLSQFVYYAIPVDEVGQGISSKAKALFPGVSGPSAKNKISQAANDTYAKLFSFGQSTEPVPPRYNISAEGMANLPLCVSYTEQVWSEWGAAAIPDPMFLQMMINLNTGHIFYGDGTSNGKVPAPLVGSDFGKSVRTFLGTKYGQLLTAGSRSNFKEFVDSVNVHKFSDIHPALLQQFNCSCLDNENGVVSEQAVKVCKDMKGGSSCVLTKSLDQLAAGLVLNAQGTVLTPDQNLEDEIAKGALGQIIPIQGLGKNFNKVLQMFPGAQQDVIANSGVLTISLGTDLSKAAAKVDVTGADADNYAAKGVYIYQCKNTPFAKMLQSQTGGKAEYNSHITDYVIFLDKNLKVVPLMAPVVQKDLYGFMTMGLNPAVAYVSTIMGDLQEDGSFSFLPQLNIQSPPALIAKGLPASFAPLYGIQANNGTLSINYNQNLPGVVGNAVQTLLQNPQLAQQYQVMKRLYLTLLMQGPFGKYRLRPIDNLIQPVIGGSNLPLYEGFNGYPIPQDNQDGSLHDLLIPLSVQGRTVNLPSNSIANYYGIVTDLTYSVKEDGTIFVDADGFANSALVESVDPKTQNITWTIDEAKISNFYWVDLLTNKGMSVDPDFVMPEGLIEKVAKARFAWANWIKDRAGKNSSQNKEFGGMNLPGSGLVVTITSEQAFKNGLFLYTCMPSPSGRAEDYFILTNSKAPSAADKSLGAVSASDATSETCLLSIISGLLYDSAGNLVKNSAGVGYGVKASELVRTLFAARPKAFSDELKKRINIAFNQYESLKNDFIYPFPFYGLQLGIYQADLDAGCYIYGDASGAGTSESFEPQDYFMTVDVSANPFAFGKQLSNTTEYVVSLVTGRIYGPDADQSGAISAALGSIKAVAAKMRPALQDKIKVLTASAAAEQKELAALDAQVDQEEPVGSVSLSSAQVLAAIKSLASKPFLPAPYDRLKNTGDLGYVMVTPASPDSQSKKMVYTFFNVPHTFTSQSGKPIEIGAMYNDGGELLSVIDGIFYSNAIRSVGVVINPQGKQVLGVVNPSGIIVIDPADRNLKPGVSGKTMIASNDPNFPTPGIVSPVTYEDTKFYYYYNTVMQDYYVMMIKNSVACYVSLTNGDVFGLDGVPMIDKKSVASSVGSTQDFALLDVTIEGLLDLTLADKGFDAKYQHFLNSSGNFVMDSVDAASQKPASENHFISQKSIIKVMQMPVFDPENSFLDLQKLSSISVYWQDVPQPVAYQLNKSYAWKQASYIPVDMTTGSLMTVAVEDALQSMQCIYKDGELIRMIFKGMSFDVSSKQGANMYQAACGTEKMTMTLTLDPVSRLEYMKVEYDRRTYYYQFDVYNLSYRELMFYQQLLWQAIPVADVTGVVRLAKNITGFDQAELKLAMVALASVQNKPQDQTKLTTFMNQLKSVFYDAQTDRYFVKLQKGAYDYLSNSVYVDIENGIMFDEQGFALGLSLPIQHLMEVLNNNAIIIVRNEERKAVPVYRVTDPAEIAAKATGIVQGAVGQLKQSRSGVLGRLKSFFGLA